MMKVLITGGAGFVGSNLCKMFRSRYPGAEVVAFDNLRRRGSEQNLGDFKRHGIEFRHGDIRSFSDLKDLSRTFDVVVEASAEPSVHSGLTGGLEYLLDTNLVGTLNALRFASESSGTFVFLSTSRCYSIEDLKALPLATAPTRFELSTEVMFPVGLSKFGIAEPFETRRFRSLYGATKLASECFVQEFAAFKGLRAVVNRCGVLAGPGQFGRVDQGVFTMWLARHLWGGSLAYFGFGGLGLQVRDLLHPSDLFELICKQIEGSVALEGDVFNVGGGLTGSVSMLEMTQLCREISGRQVPVGSHPDTASVDIPWFVTDSRKAHSHWNWQPQHNPKSILVEIRDWLQSRESELRPLFSD